MRYLSQGSGVPIIQGAGYYVDEYIPEEMKSRSVDELRADREPGHRSCRGTDVRAGIIGEIGCMWPLRPFERKMLQAAAIAQRETGASINVHPGRHRDAPFEIVKIVAEAGGDVTRLVITVRPHVRFCRPVEPALRLADTGCVIEYDFFGIETSYYWFNDTDLPTDYMRLAYMRAFVDRGHLGQIVVSQDICTKTRLGTYGGHGYGHIFRNVVPLMRRKGFTEKESDAILTGNPRRLLTFV